MKAAELKRLLISVAPLSSGQRAELLAALHPGGQDKKVRFLLESRLTEQRACPHCQGSWIVRNGSASGPQRYKCRARGRTFNALSTTPLAKLRMKAKWLHQQDVSQQGLRVSKAASTLDVAKTTAFRWRHRCLQLAQPVKALELTGVAGCGESRRNLLLALQQRPAHWPQIARARRVGVAQRARHGLDSNSGCPRPVWRGWSSG